MTSPRSPHHASEPRLTTPSVAISRWRRGAASTRGFSLPELMTTVVVVGILATVAVNGTSSYVQTARSTEAISMLGTMKKGIMATNHQIFTDAAGETLSLGQRASGFGGPLGVPVGLFKTDKVKTNNGNDKSEDTSTEETVVEDIELNDNVNNGHGNNEGDCDPSNPAVIKKGGCDALEEEENSSDDSDDEASEDDSSDEKTNNGNGTSDDGGIDGDGNNGHGNNDDGCDPDNPGNSGKCDGDSGDDGGGDSGDDDDDGGGDASDDGGSDDSGDSGGPTAGNFGGGERVCGSATAVPSDFSAVKGKAYASGASDWGTGDAKNGWQCLNVSPPSGVIHYQYGYDRGSSRVVGSNASLPAGVDESNAFNAWARGDVDADGRNSWFVLHGALIDGQAYIAPGIEMIDRDE